MSNKKKMKTKSYRAGDKASTLREKTSKTSQSKADSFDQDFCELFDDLFVLDDDDALYDEVKKDLKALGPVADNGQYEYQNDQFNPNKIAIVDPQKWDKTANNYFRNNGENISNVSVYKDALVCTMEMAQKVASLRVNFPNFSEVIDDLVDMITLRSISAKTLSVQAINLDGQPGAGKTTFVRALAAMIGVDFFDLTISSMMEKFELCGGNPQWKNANCGRLAAIMLKQTSSFHPIILLDDLCSVNTRVESEHTLLPVLLNILEPHQAKHFKDQFYDLDIDLSGVIFISTTNNFSRLPENIQSRLSNYHIDLPVGHQFTRVVQNIYRELLAENDLLDVFSEQLSESVVTKLQNTNLRHAKRLLNRAMTRAYKRVGCRTQRPTQIAINLGDLDPSKAQTHSLTSGDSCVLH
jgi:tRNA uridine 5-carbamoylmethylation protein Kti12